MSGDERRLRIAAEALQKIVEWNFRRDYGSNGERDEARRAAREALVRDRDVNARGCRVTVMRYYWELMWDDPRGWSASGNNGIADRARFATITDAVQAGIEAGVHHSGLVYRIVDTPKTPLLVVDSRPQEGNSSTTLNTWGDWAADNVPGSGLLWEGR